MKVAKLLLSIVIIMFVSMVYVYAYETKLRAPAYPLITIDPYVSTWMPADRLYDETAIHWTETDMPMMGIIRVDGEYYRFMGTEEDVTLVPVVPMGKEKPWEASYTFEEPAGDWTSVEYDYSSWKVAAAPFGEGHQEVRTAWLTPEIWLRRTIVLDKDSITDDRYFLYYTHDGQMELYVNGERIVATGNSWKENHRVELSKEQLEEWDYTLNVAAHCKWFSDARYIDFGIYHNDNSEKLVGCSARQVSVDAQATRTIYDFTCAGVDLKLTFTAPFLMDDPDLVSRPVNYISYDVVSNDGAKHDVEIYFDAGPHWARNTDDQECAVEMVEDERFTYVRCGTEAQPVLEKKGDFIRIDWGYFYMVGDKDRFSVAAGDPDALRERFINKGKIKSSEGDYMAISSDLGKVGSKVVSGYIMLGYDDIYSIRYYGQNVRPYWNRNGDSSIQEQFVLAADQYESVIRRCEEFDRNLIKEACAAGGKEYAELCALAYRQAMAAHKLIRTPKGEMAWLSKENSSNGCIGTVDVTYPSFPLFLYYNTAFARAQLDFIFELSRTDLWNETYAPHDVGTYPHVFGQRYDGGMPVEESGNMLIMTDAICRVEGSADYALKNWDLLSLWADYLTVHGGDPVNQLCTDDFMGHSARNSNLSVKAIMGVASYADMAAQAGKEDIAEKYYRKAKEMAADWKRMAGEEDHYRLTFEPGADTWSQKYNLVWDKILGLDVFDDDIVPAELAYYATKMNEYGLPLDSRSTCTKSDWLVWTATLSDDLDTFRSFVVPMHDFYDQMTARVPLPDLYHTTSNAHSSGWLQARSVVGGFWIKMLSDKMPRQDVSCR